MVALLRAVNVGGRKLAMADLRELGTKMGWEDVSTYIQSGNLLFSDRGNPTAHEAALELAIAQDFGMKVPVMVRSASAWSTLLSGNPFPDAARDNPSRLMLMVSKAPPAAGAEEIIQKRAAGEQVRRSGDTIWIYYPDGIGRSKLTPAFIDRTIGSPATARNYRTVVKIEELLAS